ncbi:MAG: RyR domain-containing protein [Dehalococcoidia bacterium]|nr:RyR domain-containing protein [Dehalococcoidia bacterium]
MKIRELTDEFFNTFDRNGNTPDAGKALREIDRLCLQNAMSRFLMSGSKDDAFDVYFCFCEIFGIFGKGYDGTEKLLNLLGDHETNAGRILERHRDHYSHAVYVFSLGLAIYQKNYNFRTDFESGRLLSNSMSVNEEFLYRWGLAALFHDIGYPFEIAFNSIKAYTQDIFDQQARPLLTYTRIDEFVTFTNRERSLLEIIGWEPDYIESAHTLLARSISKMMGLEYRDVLNELTLIMQKAIQHMDHAYFSAAIVLKMFLSLNDITKAALEVYIDACACILLHASFWRDKLGKDRKISSKQSLAFLLMLCDELQIFDRIGYGRKSKSEPLPRVCYLDYSDRTLDVTYAFNDRAINYTDSKYADGVLVAKGNYLKGEYIEGKRDEIEKVLRNLFDLSNFGSIRIIAEISSSYRSVSYHLSASFYQNIFSLAKRVHENYLKSTTYNKIKETWAELSLELKMSNVLQAKSYAEKLNLLGYFYDDRDLMLAKVVELNEEQVEVLARAEHTRWCTEKKQMGWVYGERNDKQRKHNCLVEYDALESNNQQKDKETATNMLKNLSDAGFTIYQANKIKTEEKAFLLGITGHNDLSKADIPRIKDQLRAIFRRYASNKNYQTIVLCACAHGFDLLAAGIAMELALHIKVIFPFDEAAYKIEVESYDTERLLEKVMEYDNKEVLHIPRLEETYHVDLSKHIAGNANVLIAGWDGKANSRNGGTYDTVQLAKKYGKHIEVIEVPRAAP